MKTKFAVHWAPSVYIIVPGVDLRGVGRAPRPRRPPVAGAAVASAAPRTAGAGAGEGADRDFWWPSLSARRVDVDVRPIDVALPRVTVRRSPTTL